MNIRCASPLYILREDCQRDLFGVLKRLKDIGYDGIEFLGFFGHNAQEVRREMDCLGLTALGNHVPYRELIADTDAILSFHETVGCSFLTVAELPTEDFAAVSAQLDALAEKARAKGIRLLYHNHDGELIDKIDGQETLDYILTHTKPETLRLEPDLGWIEIGGGKCEAYLTRYADRCPVLHLKDYYATDNRLLGRVREFVPARGTAARGCFEFRPTGYGVLNLPKLLPLCLACKPEWLVMDHDLAYERDPYEDLRISLVYTKNLFAMA